MNFQTFLVISMIFLVGGKVFKFCNIPSFPQKWEFKVPNCGFLLFSDNSSFILCSKCYFMDHIVCFNHYEVKI